MAPTLYYVSDRGNHVVRYVDTTGIINTLPISSSDTNWNPALFNPFGMAEDASKNIYITDEGTNIVWKITETSAVATRVLGNGTTTFTAGPALSSGLNTPEYVVCDSAGNIYVSLSINAIIVAVNMQSTTQTLFGVSIGAGNVGIIAGVLNTPGFGGRGGPATSAGLQNPSGITLDTNGNLYICDTNNNQILKVTSAGTLTAICGTAPGGSGSTGDGGLATAAKLAGPEDVHFDNLGMLYIADASNFVMRAINLTGATQTVFGVAINVGNIDRVAGVYGGAGYTGDGGPALSAQISGMNGFGIDAAGDLYVPMVGFNVVRFVNRLSNVISSVVGKPPGTGGYTGDGGLATAAKMKNPEFVLNFNPSVSPSIFQGQQPHIFISS